MNAIYSDYSPIFLYVDKYRFSKNWGYPGSTVPYSLIRYVISGRAVFSLVECSVPAQFFRYAGNVDLL